MILSTLDKGPSGSSPNPAVESPHKIGQTVLFYLWCHRRNPGFYVWNGSVTMVYLPQSWSIQPCVNCNKRFEINGSKLAMDRECPLGFLVCVCVMSNEAHGPQKISPLSPWVSSLLSLLIFKYRVRSNMFNSNRPIGIRVKSRHHSREKKRKKKGMDWIKFGPS